MLANMMHRVKFGGISEHPIAVSLYRIISPRIPQGRDDINKFRGPCITLVTGWHCGHRMIMRLGVEHGGHHVPTNPPAANVVQRGEHPCHVERGVECGGHGRNEPNTTGVASHGGQRGERFSIPQWTCRWVSHGLSIRKEY